MPQAASALEVIGAPSSLIAGPESSILLEGSAPPRSLRYPQCIGRPVDYMALPEDREVLSGHQRGRWMAVY